VSNENSTGAGTPVELGRDALNESATTLPSNPNASNQAKLLRVVQHEKPANVVATVAGYPPFVTGSKKLRSAKRFQAVCLYRFGAELVFEGDWASIVATARKQGGAA
jgi:hypothetical protein